MKKRRVDDSPSSLKQHDVFRGETFRYRISPDEVKDRVTAMKDYLKSIVETPPAESVPQPHPERHQAWILLRGNTKQYRRHETYTLGADTFSYFIYPDVCWFSVSRHSKIDQTKNQNRPIDKVQNLGNERRYIYKDPRQDSGQRNISYTRYPKKCFTQIYRDLYGDAMLVLTWMSSNMADGNQQKHLLPSFATKA